MNSESIENDKPTAVEFVENDVSLKNRIKLFRIVNTSYTKFEDVGGGYKKAEVLFPQLTARSKNDVIGEFLKTGHFNVECFVSFLWDNILKSEFSQRGDMNTNQEDLLMWIVSVLNKIVLIPYGRTIIFHLFHNFTKMVNSVGENSVQFDWVTFPAPFRMLAVSTNIFLNDQLYNCKEWYISILQGLPHEILLLRWTKFRLGKRNLMNFGYNTNKVSFRYDAVRYFLRFLIKLLDAHSSIAMFNTQYGLQRTKK